MQSKRLFRRMLVVVLVSLASASPLEAEVLVSAASSLTEVLTAVAKQFEVATGERVLLNFGASNTLARQIAAGAKVDVFISADGIQMDRVGAEIAPGTRIDLLSNRLAVAVPRDAAALVDARALLAPSIRRIAIGDPAAVPAGVYARQYLEARGLWTALGPKLVPAGSVRLALAAVEAGAADAAIVYVTDVPTAAGAKTAFVVDVNEGPAIRYPAAVMRGAQNPSMARRFLAYLRTPDAGRRFTAAGFGLVSDAAERRRP